MKESVFSKVHRIKNDVEKRNFKPITKGLPVWNVFMYDINGKQITIRNLFRINWCFNRDVYRLYQEFKEGKIKKAYFFERLESLLMYYMWSRYEYEICVCADPISIDATQCQTAVESITKDLAQGVPYPRYYFRPEGYETVDVYSQVMMNWDAFQYYVSHHMNALEHLKDTF